MKRFVLLIFLFLMCFLFMISGGTFDKIVPMAGQTIAQAAASPNLTDNEIINLFCNDAKSNFADDYVIFNQSPGMIDNQTTIKNIKDKTIVSKADGTIASETGTVLKGPHAGSLMTL